MMVILLTSLIGYFFYVHFNLLINNQTTIDSIEKKNLVGKNDNVLIILKKDLR